MGREVKISLYLQRLIPAMGVSQPHTPHISNLHITNKNILGICNPFQTLNFFCSSPSTPGQIMYLFTLVLGAELTTSSLPGWRCATVPAPRMNCLNNINFSQRNQIVQEINMYRHSRRQERKGIRCCGTRL